MSSGQWGTSCGRARAHPVGVCAAHPAEAHSALSWWGPQVMLVTPTRGYVLLGLRGQIIRGAIPSIGWWGDFLDCVREVCQAEAQSRGC